MKALYYIGILPLSIGGSYLAGAFIKWELNPAIWSQEARIALLAIALIIFIAGCGFVSIHFIDSKND